MQLAELARTLISNHSAELPRRKWPEVLYVPPGKQGGLMGFGAQNRFWQNITKLRDFTDKGSENFSEEHSGSTGWEYQMQMLYVDGDFYYSTPGSSRDYSKVTGSQTLKIDSNLDSSTQKLTDTFILNNKVLTTRSFIGQKRIEERNRMIGVQEYLFGFFCHFHSHPKHQVQGLKRKIYTFFSRQDFFSFMSGNQPLMGLVTDRLWLLGQAEESGMPSHRELQEVTKAEALRPEQLVTVASDLMSRHEWVLYTGKFGDKQLQRVA